MIKEMSKQDIIKCVDDFGLGRLGRNRFVIDIPNEKSLYKTGYLDELLKIVETGEEINNIVNFDLFYKSHHCENLQKSEKIRYCIDFLKERQNDIKETIDSRNLLDVGQYGELTDLINILKEKLEDSQGK